MQMIRHLPLFDNCIYAGLSPLFGYAAGMTAYAVAAHFNNVATILIDQGCTCLENYFVNCRPFTSSNMENCTTLFNKCNEFLASAELMQNDPDVYYRSIRTWSSITIGIAGCMLYSLYRRR